MAAAAAATARATITWRPSCAVPASARCCSTCSVLKKTASTPTVSTSRCSPNGSAWLGLEPLTAPLPLGLFGASTGAAAALQLAARDGSGIAAVVSRGGRPDLAGPTALPAVGAPTLLLVGGEDGVVIDLNRQALDALRCEKRLVIIPGANHLFEEPGTLEAVAAQAADWFVRHLGPP